MIPMCLVGVKHFLADITQVIDLLCRLLRSGPVLKSLNWLVIYVFVLSLFVFLESRFLQIPIFSLKL